MPLSKVAFPQALVQDLELLREEAGLTQKKLAKLAGVAQGTYSNLILEKAVRAKSARAVIAAIRQAAEQYILRTNRSSEETARIRHVVARAMAVLKGRMESAAGELDEQAGQNDVEELDRVVLRVPTPIKLHPPGGAVPSDSTPYLARHDEQIMDMLGRWPLRLLVRGPSHCGKSTALALLARRAHEKGIETAWFDVESTEASTSPPSDRDAPVASALCEVLQASWNLPRPRRGAIYSFARLNLWLSEELASSPPKPRLLVLDELTALGGPAANRLQRQLLRHLCYGLSARKLESIGVAASMTEYFSQDPLAISSWNPTTVQPSGLEWNSNPTVHSSWFVREEVTELHRRLLAVQSTDVNDQSLDALFTALGGQPYLTHAALIDSEFRDALLRWNYKQSDLDTATNRIRGSAWYRRHKRHIRRAICGTPTESNEEYVRIIKLLHDAWFSSNGAPPEGSDFFHTQFLIRSCLIRVAGVPTTSLYHLIAQDLYEEIIENRPPKS